MTNRTQHPPASFAAVLASAAEGADLRKTERTRLRLLAATAARLEAGEERSDLRVSDIATEAGVAHGTFYRYFPDRRAAVEALVADFTDFLGERLGLVRDGAPASPERVRAATLAYVRLFRANVGLMRCLMDPGPDSAGFRERFHALNRLWNGRVAAAIAARRSQIPGARPVESGAMLPTAYVLGGMVDEFLNQLYLRRDAALAGLAADEDGVADLLTDLWCRGAYGVAGAVDRASGTPADSMG
jgi:AcrR family transcriptional regulator